MKEIQLTKGYVTQVDDEDYEWLNSFCWQANVGKTGHVAAMKHKTEKSPFIYMSRMILNATDPNIKVDHKDRNPLNNRRSNLRTCTQGQNVCNTTSAKNSTSKYLGVSLAKRNKKWVATIKWNYKKIHLGTFVSEDEAALVYNKKAFELRGEFANLNRII